MVKSLLIVDDSESDRYIVERHVKKSGLFDHVYSLSDGEEAYDHFKDEAKSKAKLGDFFPPSVVVLDINMPRMNGFEFLEKFEKLPSNYKNILFVAMLTSSQDERDEKTAMESSYVETFLAKPFQKAHVKLLSDMINERQSKLSE